MKTRTSLLLAFCTLFLVSCKNDKQSKDGAAPTTEKGDKKEIFSVDLQLMTDKPDDIPLYFTEDGTTNFGGPNIKWTNIKAQPSVQTINLSLAEEVVPTAIRIDFGIKKGNDQADITLQKFKMSYNGKSFETKGSDFLNYFIKNDSVQTQVDAAKGTITFLKNPKSKLTRFYYPQQKILDELKKITK